MHITEFNKVTCAYAQSIWLYLTLCYSLDCSPSGSSVHGILQTRTLEWVARPSPGNFPNPGIELKSPASSALQGDSWPLSHQSLSVTKHACFHAKLLQLCPTLCDPMDCSPPGSSVHGTSQARVLEWVAMPFSRRSFPPRDWTWVSYFADRFCTIWASMEAPWINKHKLIQNIEVESSGDDQNLWWQNFLFQSASKKLCA